jgi:hypothetical protein
MEEGEDSTRWVATFRGGRWGEGEKISGPPGAWDSAWDPDAEAGCPQPPEGCPVLTYGGAAPFTAGPDGTAMEYGVQFTAGPDGTAVKIGEATQFTAGELPGVGVQFEAGNTINKKEWTPIEEGCKACSREVGGTRVEQEQGEGTGAPVSVGGPTVLDSEGGVITSRLCDRCVKLWRSDGQPNPWFPANGPGGSHGGPKPKQRKPVGMGV